MARRVLFLCSRNRLRSPTAEQVFGTWPDLEVDSAGLADDAEMVLTSEQLDWADLIVVMEASHRRRLQTCHRSRLKGKRWSAWISPTATISCSRSWWRCC